VISAIFLVVSIVSKFYQSKIAWKLKQCLKDSIEYLRNSNNNFNGNIRNDIKKELR